VLAEFGSNLRLYVCGHGDKDESQLVGQTSHNQELAHAVGSSGIYYDSGKFRSSTDVITYRYVLLPGAPYRRAQMGEIESGNRRDLPLGLSEPQIKVRDSFRLFLQGRLPPGNDQGLRG